MSPGYSTKIYKKRKRPVFPYIIISLIVIAISVFISLNKHQKEARVSNIIHENNSEPEKNIPKPEKIDSRKVEKELLIVPEENITVDQNIKGAGIPSMGIAIGGEGYQTGISVSIKQEMLKNFFGEADRLAELWRAA